MSGAARPVAVLAPARWAAVSAVGWAERELAMWMGSEGSVVSKLLPRGRSLYPASLQRKLARALCLGSPFGSLFVSPVEPAGWPLLGRQVLSFADYSTRSWAGALGYK